MTVQELRDKTQELMNEIDLLTDNINNAVCLLDGPFNFHSIQDDFDIDWERRSNASKELRDVLAQLKELGEETKVPGRYTSY